MPILNNQWKSDNYKFVGKSFDIAYANKTSNIMKIVGRDTVRSVDYELTGSGGYGEMQKYDGSNLNMVGQKRAFKSRITPEEFSGSVDIGMKQAKIDKSGECKKAGNQLGYSMAMTVYLHLLRMFSGAFNPAKLGGDKQPWASTAHPIASKGSEGRDWIPDPDSGTYSNFLTNALSVQAITTAQTQASRFVTPDGLPFAADMDTLLVSPELEATAAKICGPDGKISLRPTKNPEDDTNAANPVYGMGYIVVGGGLDGFSAKQWALCDRTLMQEIVKLVYGTEPSVMENELDNPLVQRFTAYSDFGMGWGDARQIIFNDAT